MAAFRSDLSVVDPPGSLLDRAIRLLRSLRSLARSLRLPNNGETSILDDLGSLLLYLGTVLELS